MINIPIIAVVIIYLDEAVDLKLKPLQKLSTHLIR